MANIARARLCSLARCLHMHIGLFASSGVPISICLNCLESKAAYGYLWNLFMPFGRSRGYLIAAKCFGNFEKFDKLGAIMSALIHARCLKLGEIQFSKTSNID